MGGPLPRQQRTRGSETEAMVNTIQSAGDIATVRFALLGLRVDAVTPVQALDFLAATVESHRRLISSPSPGEGIGTRQIVTLNPEIVMAARRDAALREAIAGADLVVPDGIGVVWAARLRGMPLAERVTGVDLLDAIAGLAAARGWGLYLLGAAPGVAELAGARLREQHPGLRIVGACAGSPVREREGEITARIRASGADLIFVAFGSPAQERWIARTRGELGAAVAVGVGGAFDFLAGRVPRAPGWMRRGGLEWLYRLWREPWRWRRMLALPAFALAAGGESLQLWLRHEHGWESVLDGREQTRDDADITAQAQPSQPEQHNSANGRNARMGYARRERLLALVRRFAGKRVLVAGDMVADEYIVGAPERISREAPVLILRHADQFTVPGGATNPGVNARTLGAEVFLAGVVGDDEPGQRLCAVLRGHGVHMDGLFNEPGRPTSTKTRILAGGTQLVQQQIVRVDRVDDSEPSDDCIERMIAYLQRMIPTVDALILSDYDGGVINKAIIEATLPLARAHGKLIIVDSHGDLARFQNVTALTPNQPEAEATLGIRITDRVSLEHAGARLLEETQARGVLITRGSEGMSLFERGQPPIHIPASNLTAVADPTGAGDTVAATFTLALAAGATMAEAALLANIAAGRVVRLIGCATNTPDELSAAIVAQVED
ncbi:MAG: D-glycero-beta-D-manno-heptose 1-phosphate adenylyltransferase/ D-glycero-beta-D-manno-heptose-7-phosphate kinase [Ktedonobacterales bacterium]|jgi:rfaE bifunctional protein kinase chain/domain|nr:MAG: D-glycero-beta-D-manno-heptose 1-phosphate adenylyltransferase/ D-glycero-beta-D-manno-heptose-7-phosphate kinase [Ktedonobacterales bacterium]